MIRRARRPIAVLIMTAAFLIGTGAASNAGELCVRFRLVDPLDQVKVCANSNPLGR